ncbi:MAG: glycosyltransferase family 4 protein [Pseudomonadota bacterium]
MNVLIINYEFPPIGGGGSKASYELAKRLVAMGHRITVLTGRYGGAERVEVIDGITVRRVPSWRKSIHDCGLRGAVSFLLTALPALRRLLRTEAFDITHYFFSLPTGALALYSHGVGGVPYVVSLRGSDVPQYDRDSATLRWLHPRTRWLTHRIWRNARAVTAVSNGLRDLALQSFPDVSDIRVIYNGVDVDPEPPDRLGRGDGPVRINCVARLIARKGIGGLLRAVAALDNDNVELHIIGTGPAEAELGELAQSLQIVEQTVFHGYCDRDEVHRLNREADVFVLPTLSEAFANVILEAMSVALPVVATRVGGIPEAVIDNVTGRLVEPRDTAALTDALQELCADPVRRTTMGRAGYERVCEQFTWDVNARKFERLLLECCDAPTGRRSPETSVSGPAG